MARRKRWYLPGVIMGLALVLLMADMVLPGNSARATDPVEEQGLVDMARILFQSFMADKDMSWFREHLKNAKGFLIIPSLLKGGFIIGGTGGSGVFVMKGESGNWSQPAFYTVGSVTFGLQIGGEKSEIIMMARTQRGVETFYTSSFKLGGDLSVAAGPVGGGAKGTVMADLVSFVRSKGVYGGVSLEGAVIEARDKRNKAYYGKEVRPVDILVQHEVSNPGAAQLLKVIGDATR